MSYRKLSNSEITQLKENGCYAEDWSLVEVKQEFTPERVQKVYFAGEIKLGLFSGKIEAEEGIKKPSGIYQCYIKDCTIGDNVYIANVNNLVAYHISENVAIENVNTLIVNTESTFGNGIELDVLNEGGGRELPIFDKMSAQIAYLITNYRHDSKLIKNLTRIITNYVTQKKSGRGKIENGAKILNAATIKNVHIGSYATVYGAKYLENGTIQSCKEAPAMVGTAVNAQGFIILSGSEVDSGAIIENSFIGQSVELKKQFSVENSAIFANSQGFHGEAVSIFAGPYTVTHHKSTLLIAGQYSFYNAGSGSNKSNHLYKLGPVHQGTLERGSKTGSFSYMIWPCHVGPFSIVLGKHNSNFDISQFPFSYIDAKDGKSELIPGLNLFTVGTIRDSEKWPKRDKRTDPNPLDLIHFTFFSPYIVQKMVNGNKVLEELKAGASKKQPYVTYKGAHIPRLILRTAWKYYEIGIKVYLGNELTKQLEKSKATAFDKLKQELIPNSNKGEGQWVDVAGMFATKHDIDELTESIRNDQISSVDELISEFKTIYNNYESSSWTWCASLISERLGINFTDITKENLITILQDWKDNVEKMNNMIIKDGEKEFGANNKIGFGIDGDEQIRDTDFEAVRGTHKENSFIKKLESDTAHIKEKADNLIEKLKSM